MAYTNDKKFNFEYPELTKIHGEPDATTLLNMTKELKANAQSQRSSLGGGHYGYLSLVISQVEYMTLPNSAPLLVPIAPPPFTVPPGTTAVQSMVLKTTWENDTKDFSEYMSMQLALKNQICQAIDMRYLKAIRNTITNSITRPVLEILSFLKSRYGRVNIIQLSEAETVLKTLVYDLSRPIDEAIFQRINDYAEMADMAFAPISERQKIDLAMLMLIKSKRFKVDIRTWNATDPAYKTWDNFQDDFRAAYDSIRDLGDLTVDESPVLNQAQLMESIMHAMQEANRGIPVEEEEDPILRLHDPPPQERANNAFENTLMRKFEELSAELAALRQTTGRNSRSRSGRTPKRYCWSCGCCSHWGKNCENKKTGHKDDATFPNRKGGSNENCRPNA